MARCPICGTLLDRIELDSGSYVDDDCPRCTPRGEEKCDSKYDDDIRGPEPCYFCGKPRDDYTGMLCDGCRDEAKRLGGE